MIHITKPFLPPLEEYNSFIAEIWSRNWLTNNGPLVNKLESELKKHLDIKHLLYTTNGTIAIQIAIKALGLKGEIITTPFSYVATTSSIVWENCQPVFVDINLNSFNIDETKIEKAITEKTSAILATHVYGNPCEVDQIEKIALKHNLKVIYDAAHCFGSKYNNRTLLDYGDITTISFHATKVFHTIEGGALITKDPDLLKKMSRMRNFGHAGPEHFEEVGINGKNSEFHAAMGLVNLKYIGKILDKRKKDHERYDKYLSRLKLQKPKLINRGESNYSYYAVAFKNEQQCLKVFKALEEENIFARRYFHPNLADLPYIEEKYSLDNTNNLSKRILCLPLFYELTSVEIEMICSLILKNLK